MDSNDIDCSGILFINITGRLSVAIFGLTFNLADESGIEYPVLLTNWNATNGPWMEPEDSRIEYHLRAEINGRDLLCVIALMHG